MSSRGNIASLLLITVALSGCSGGDEFADIRQFMKDVEAKDAGTIAALPEFEPYQPFSYGAASKRSPFVPPVVIPKKTEEQIKNIGVKPPKDHVPQFLERFDLASLSMVGTLQQNNETWALIEDDTGGVHRVQVGDFMGKEWGKIESINDTRIDITEIVGDGADGWLRRPRALELKNLN